MPLSNISASLQPNGFNRNIAGWIGAELLRTGFDISSTSRVRDILAHHRVAPDLIRPEALEDGGLLAHENLLFPKSDGWILRVAIRAAAGSSASVETTSLHEDLLMTPQQLEQVMATIRQGAPWLGGSDNPTTPPTLAEEFSLTDSEANRFLQTLRQPERSQGAALESSCAHLSSSLAAAYRQTREEGTPLVGFPRIEAPGIYRREHASLVIRSRTTSIVADPVCLWRGYPNLWAAPTGREPDIDAIFITHGHQDHFNIPSIIHCAGRSDVPVFVPHVPRTNCLSLFDMRGALESFGQTTQAPQLWTTVVVGDITVDILPFYGEQPTRDSPGAPPALRNWGICYRFNTPEFSALVLVDSGADPAGSMEDVVRISRTRRGAPDVLLTSLPVFLSPFFGGLMTNYIAVPVARLRVLFEDFKARRLPSSPPGLREFLICAGSPAHATT